MKEKEKYKKPVCPYCARLGTLKKSGKWYVCGVCHRMTLKFIFAGE